MQVFVKLIRISRYQLDKKIIKLINIISVNICIFICLLKF